MIVDKNIQQKTETNFTQLVKTSTQDLLGFIEVCLNNFPEIYKQEFGSFDYQKEPVVNDLLVTYFACQVRDREKPYNFISQKPEKLADKDFRKAPEPDIGVIAYVKNYFNSKAFFVIECKWLRSNSQSNQYVNGKSGAIERFKKQIHGRELNHSAIIGYVKDNCFNFWQNEKVNTWIKTLISNENEKSLKWEKSDLLLLIEESQDKKIARYYSKSKRENDYIELYHFWVKIQK